MGIGIFGRHLTSDKTDITVESGWIIGEKEKKQADLKRSIGYLPKGDLLLFMIFFILGPYF